MQVMNKLEQQDYPTSQNLQVDVKKLINCLESGKKSAHMMRSLILQNNTRVKMEYDDDQHQDHQYKSALLKHHSIVCLDTYASSLSMLKSLDFDRVFDRKRKQENFDDADNHCSSYEESADQGSPIVNVKRDCSKRRKFGDSSREEEVTQLTDDGFAWRKYGQKLILNSYHPRHYYRCTHKNDQKCEATKQVQQISDKPIKYKVIYYGNHTCNKNIDKIDPFIIDSLGVHPSAFVLNFDGTNLVNPMLFPTSSTFSDVKVNRNSPSASSSNNNNLSVSQNTTATTTRLSSSLVYEESSELSIAENYYSSNTATSANLEEDYSLIMADFSDILPFW